MNDPWDELRPRLQFGLSEDLPIVLHQNERSNGVVNPQAEILEHALLLRKARLKRMSQEVAFMQMEDGDGEQLTTLDNVIATTVYALGRIEAALSKGLSRNKHGKKAY